MNHVSEIVRAPGGGLLSFTTGSQKARKMLGEFVSDASFENWTNVLTDRMLVTEPFGIIGIPSDCGGGICRGTAHGPLHIREEMYHRNHDVVGRDLGDIPCVPHLLHDSMLCEKQRQLSGQALWGEPYREGDPVSPLSILEEWLCQIWGETPEFRPLTLGGDHSISGAVFAALHRMGKLERLAVLQLDAHTDLLESRFGVEHCFATWTAHAVKKMPDPARWVQIGIRASGYDQQFWESKFGLRQFWAKQIVQSDAEKFAMELVSTWKQQGCDRLYVSNDIDGIDQQFAPSTGTPEPNGLTPEWTTKVLEICSRELPLVGADLPEVAPVLGSEEDGKRTVKTAVDLIESLNWI